MNLFHESLRIWLELCNWCFTYVFDLAPLYKIYFPCDIYVLGILSCNHIFAEPFILVMSKRTIVKLMKGCMKWAVLPKAILYCRMYIRYKKFYYSLWTECVCKVVIKTLLWKMVHHWWSILAIRGIKLIKLG